MKLTKFTLGQIVSIGLASIAFILVVKFVGRRTGWPVFKQLAESL